MRDEAERMMSLFEGFDGAHGTHGQMVRDPDKNKLEIKASARTVRGGPTIDLWIAHLSGGDYLGVVPIRADGTCVWGCIDVDRYDLDHGAIVRQLAEAGLPLVVCRTKSGGAHIFLFASGPVPAVVMQSKLRDLAAHLGFGGSEIFPKQTRLIVESGDAGNWLNMPYHNGDETSRYAVNDRGRGLTLRQFLSLAESRRISPEEVEDLRPATKKAPRDEMADGPPCLQHLVSVGFPEGSRNNGLFSLGVFLRKKHPDTWEQLLEQENQRHFSPPLSSTEVQEVIRSLKKKDYQYKCKDMPIANHCNAGLCRTRRYGVGRTQSTPMMESLAMFRTDQPIWFLNVAGERIELTTDELQNPRLFQKKCMEEIQTVVPIMKRETWEGILQGLYENLTIIEAPPEASLKGQFFEHLETFCTDRQSARSMEEIVLGKPWHEELSGRIYFRLRDVQEYLERVRFREMTRSQMTSRIRELGGSPHFFNIKGRGVNVFWVPARIFEVQQEAHELPQVQEDVI